MNTHTHTHTLIHTYTHTLKLTLTLTHSHTYRKAKELEKERDRERERAREREREGEMRPSGWPAGVAAYHPPLGFVADLCVRRATPCRCLTTGHRGTECENAKGKGKRMERETWKDMKRERERE